MERNQNVVSTEVVIDGIEQVLDANDGNENEDCKDDSVLSGSMSIENNSAYKDDTTSDLPCSSVSDSNLYVVNADVHNEFTLNSSLDQDDTLSSSSNDSSGLTDVDIVNININGPPCIENGCDSEMQSRTFSCRKSNAKSNKVSMLIHRHTL